MIKTKTPAQKRALAEALRLHDPGYLEDLRTIVTPALGPAAWAVYVPDEDEGGFMVEAYKEALEEEEGRAKEKARSALAAARKACE